jgi:M6 family metalloprotease-like protein
MKRLFVILSLMVVTMTMMAVPAKRGVTKTLVLANGTEVKATLVGDEHGHYWKGTDGQAYRESEGVFVPIDAQAVMERAKVRRQQINQKRMQRLKGRRAGASSAYQGQKKGIIILVNFKDKSFNASHDSALYVKIANGENYSEGKFKGSMSDYFKAQSGGQFELDFDIVGPVTVANKASYYGSNDGNGDDKHPGEMVVEAVKKAKAIIDDWTPYDWDGDGYVDQVYVIYAGKGEADGGASSTIWPHAYSLSAAKYYNDGTGPVTVGTGLKVDTYACGPELDGQYSNQVAGIGTMCHEFSHCLGYPDFYDTDYSGGQGMCSWDLMDQGSYNDNGYQPAGYTSWERWEAGWQTPITLDAEDVTVEGMKSLQEGGDFYIIYNPGNKNEYFMLENRQFDGWDASLPGAGLLILHVDYSASAWEYNTPNDTPSHQRMTWVPADKKYQYMTYDGTKYYDVTGIENDPFPYMTNNSFNKDFGTMAKLFNKNTDGTYYLNSSVEEITRHSDGTMSFKYVAKYGDDPTVDPTDPTVDPTDPTVDPDDPTVDPTDPTVDPTDPTVDPTDPTVDPDDPTVDPDDPTVDPDDPAVDPDDPTIDPDDPSINPVTPPVENALFYESFERCKGQGGNDGKWSGNMSTADFIPDNQGWTAFDDLVYGASQCARFGNSKSGGSGSTPVFTVDGTAKLTFKAAAWNTKSEGTDLILTVPEGCTITPREFEMTKGEFKEFEATITATGDVRVVFGAGASKGRFFLDDVLVVDGSETEGTTAIMSVDNNREANNQWYTLDGRKLNNKPTSKGLYIVDGTKVVIK